MKALIEWASGERKNGEQIVRDEFLKNEIAAVGLTAFFAMTTLRVLQYLKEKK